MPVLMACQRRLLWRRGCAALQASMTALLASCAAQATPDLAATAPAQAGRLRILQARAGHAVPIEGALSYIRLERATGTTVTERQLPGRTNSRSGCRPARTGC